MPPEFNLKVTRQSWLYGVAELRRRGNGRHESGAFLLGRIVGTERIVSDWVFYDDLDPRAYSTGICILYAGAFDRLWQICQDRGLAVVADVHTHGGSAHQSSSDRENPMIARHGHLALIVPSFAADPVWRHQMGVYSYLGDHQWIDHSGFQARGCLKTGTFA